MKANLSTPSSKTITELPRKIMDIRPETSENRAGNNYDKEDSEAVGKGSINLQENSREQGSVMESPNALNVANGSPRPDFPEGASRLVANAVGRHFWRGKSGISGPALSDEEKIKVIEQFKEAMKKL